jgi:hypothetical protein
MKPKKIIGVRYDRGSNSQSWKEGYNQAIDDFNSWLGSDNTINKVADVLDIYLPWDRKALFSLAEAICTELTKDYK